MSPGISNRLIARVIASIIRHDDFAYEKFTAGIATVEAARIVTTRKTVQELIKRAENNELQAKEDLCGEANRQVVDLIEVIIGHPSWTEFWQGAPL